MGFGSGEMVGRQEDLNLMTDDDGVYNYRVEELYIYNNTFSGSGTDYWLSLDLKMVDTSMGRVR